MIFAQTKKRLFKTLIMILIASQFALVGTYLLTPKPAKAFWGIGDFTFNTEVANWYDIFKDIGLAAAQRIAINYANKYITRFVDKLIDKYRIKDYLAYDKVLSGYYLNQWIYQNVSDPDLRAIYGLLATDINTRATVTDASGKKTPVLAALKLKLDTYFINQGGIDPQKIYNPSSYKTDREYFAAAQAYFSNPPSFTEQNLYGQFGQQVAASQKAAGIEIANSSGGLKNDRSKPAGSTGVVDRYCDGGARAPMEYTDPATGAVVVYPKDPILDEATCTLADGIWKVDTLGITQSVIQNPSGFIHDFATSGIKELFSNNFAMRDKLYTTIGSLLGNFLFTRLNLVSDKSTNQGFDGALNEKGKDYAGDTGRVLLVQNIDADADNIPDGQDVDNDGKLNTPGVDTCYHGGIAPNCKASKTAVTSPYFTPICQAIDNAVTSLTEYARFIDANADQMEDGGNLKGAIILKILTAPSGIVLLGFLWPRNIDNFKNKADADVWARRTGEADSAIDSIVSTVQNYHNPYFDKMEFTVGRYEVYLSSVLQSLQKDKDLDLARFGNGGGGLENLMKNTGYTLRYLIELKKVIGKCDDPNLKAIGDVPSVVIDDPGDGGEDTGPTCDEVPTAKACTLPDSAELVRQVKSYLVSVGIYPPGGGSDIPCSGYEIVRRVAWELRSTGAGTVATFHSSKCSASGMSGDLIGYPDNSYVDILVGGTEPAWQPSPGGPPEPGVYYVAPTDAGDPSDACYKTLSCP